MLSKCLKLFQIDYNYMGGRIRYWKFVWIKFEQFDGGYAENGLEMFNSDWIVYLYVKCYTIIQLLEIIYLIKRLKLIVKKN